MKYPDCEIHRIPQGLIERAREILSYNSEAGIFTWINPPSNHSDLLGCEAGATASGYRAIQIDGKKYKAHRLAWLLHYGAWPKGIIDHINRNPLDNRIANLRDCRVSDNNKNHGKSGGKIGLPLGVRRTKAGSFTARIRCDKVLINIGTFKTTHEASAAYQKARKELFKEFA